MDLLIENQTEQLLTIYVHGEKISDVQPRAQINIMSDMNVGVYEIEARNSQGEIVFSEIYTYNPNDKYHLQKIGDGVYKAVILPP